MKYIHITLIGKESLPAYYPIAESRPDLVFAIGTRQSRQAAERLREVLVTRLGIECEINCQADAFDLQSVELYCEELHKSFEPDSEVIYNITGGTKLMAIGAYKAALHHKAQVIYTNSDACIDIETNESTPLACMVDNETIFALQGQHLKSYDVYTPQAEKILAAQSICSFLRDYNNKGFHSCLVREYMRSALPKHYTAKGYGYDCAASGITITRNYRSVLDISCPDARQLLLEGRWWEVLIADILDQWSGGRFTIWTNVVFVPREENNPDGKRDKNEVDVLVNTGNKLLFVECKSGNFNQDNINKLAFVRQNYGSDKSMCVLISYYPVGNDLRERAVEAKVNLIAPSKGDGTLKLNKIAARLDEILNQLKA